MKCYEFNCNDKTEKRLEQEWITSNEWRSEIYERRVAKQSKWINWTGGGGSERLNNDYLLSNEWTKRTLNNNWTIRNGNLLLVLATYQLSTAYVSGFNNDCVVSNDRTSERRNERRSREEAVRSGVGGWAPVLPAGILLEKLNWI